MPSLLDLSVELVTEISTFLNPVTFGRFRLTCKQIHDYLQQAFESQFKKRQVMIEHECLEALVNISRHHRLSPRIQGIEIDSHVFPESAYWDEHAESSKDFRLGRLRRGHLPRDALIATGHAHHMLAEAFANFPNLQRIDINRSQIRSWGSSYSKYSVKSFPDDQRPWLLPPMVMSALAEAGARPNTIGIHMRKGSLESFAIPMNTKVRDMLNKLDVFMINLGCPTEGWDYLDLSRYDCYPGAVLEAPLRALMHHLTSLTYLELTFSVWNPIASTFLAWLSKMPKTIDLPPDISIPAVEMKTLRRLHIKKAVVPLDVLLAVCLRFNLSGLSITRVSIVEKDSIDIIGACKNCWHVFLRKLSAALISRQFEYMVLMQVTQYVEDNPRQYGEFRRVDWLPASPDPRKPNEAYICTSYRAAETSETISQWLENTADRTCMGAEGYVESDSDSSSAYSTEDESDT